MSVLGRLASLSLGILLFLVLLSLPVSASARSAQIPGGPISPAYVGHVAIVISSDSGFTAANGVTGGSGTLADPYVIEGWRINASSGGDAAQAGITIRNTHAFVVVQGVQIYDDACALDGSGCAGYGIEIMNASNVHVRGVDVSGASYGVAMGGVTDSRAENSTVVATVGGMFATHSYNGPEVDFSTNVTMDGNMILAHGFLVFGISIAGNHSVVSGNTIVGAYEPLIVGANDIVASRNLAVGAGYAGIEVRYSTGVLVDSNDFVDIADGAQAVLEYKSTSVTVTRNLFRGLGGMGVVMEDEGQGSAFYHNNFNASVINASQAGTNAWDDGYPDGGNFWSDYAGVDLCSGPTQSVCTGPDGIGDTPRPIIPSGADRYPLMQPFSIPNFVPAAFFTVSAHAVNSTTPIVVNASASVDAQDPASALEVRWDWNDDGTWDTSWTAVKTAEHSYPSAGAFRIRLAVRDTSGLESNTTRSIVVDNEAPTASASVDGTPGSDGWYRSSVLITFTTTDDFSGIAFLRYRMDGGAWSEWPLSAGSLSSELVLGVGEGVHSIDYYAVDDAKNAGTPKSLVTRSDGSEPILSSLSPSGVLTTSQLTISWTGTDSVSGIGGYSLSIDGGPFVDVGNATEKVLTLPDGVHAITVRAFDAAGNNATVETSFRIDTNPLSLTGPYGAVPAAAVGLGLLGLCGILALLFLRRRRHRNPPPGNP